MSTYNNPDRPGRRNALKIISAIGATCAYPYASDELYAQTVEHHHDIAPAAPLPKPTHFSEGDLKLIARVTDLIIPETDTPGAVSAGVPIYIDQVIGRNKQQQPLVREGLAWLEEKHFLSLSEEHQLKLLKPLCEKSDAGELKEKPVQFFHLIKNLTADGYYTSQAGLMQELKYPGNTALAEFPTCVHEH